MSHNIGIMQGRLSPSVDGKIQFFPWDTWEKEFFFASELGFSEIEFIFDYENYLLNPVFSNGGPERINGLVDKTGVKVRFICADYFMQKPFFRTDMDDVHNNTKVLKHLIYQAGRIKAKGIEIPLVDNSSIKNQNEAERLIAELRPALVLAERFNIEIGLETDLAPAAFASLLRAFDHPLIKANYDIGNSASLGFDPEEEFREYGKYVNNIHVKDRKLHGGTVPLGTGSADFAKVRKALNETGYSGGFILQAARSGDDIANAKKNLLFTKDWLKGAKR